MAFERKPNILSLKLPRAAVYSGFIASTLSAIAPVRRFRTLSIIACAVSALSFPANAQQRIQIGDLIQRIDRLETEVTRLRVSPGGGGSDVARLDQIEQELRRLTGIIERLDFESRKSASSSEKRMDGLQERVEALEERGASSGPVSTTRRTDPAPAFASSNPPAGAPIFAPQGEPYQPQAGFAPNVSSPNAGPTLSADELYGEGVRLLNVGSFDRAGAQFEDLIASYPQSPRAGEAQFWLGHMHFELGRFEQAASAFLDSFRNWPEGPKAPDSLLKLGMTLANIGKTEEACLSFKQVPARYPGASQSLLRRAAIEGQRYRCS